MWQLFHILPLLVGDLVPTTDVHYKNFLTLQEISAILCTDIITDEHPGYLRNLIQQYLSGLLGINITFKCY